MEDKIKIINALERRNAEIEHERERLRTDILSKNTEFDLFKREHDRNK